MDAAGKTTILYKLKLGEIVTTIPTIGESRGEAGRSGRAAAGLVFPILPKALFPVPGADPDTR